MTDRSVLRLEMRRGSRLAPLGWLARYELTACPVINPGETSKPRLNADTEFRNTCCHLNEPELELTTRPKTPRLCSIGLGQAAIDFLGFVMEGLQKCLAAVALYIV